MGICHGSAGLGPSRATGALGTAQDNTSAVKILHVPQLIIAINYLYRYSHFYKEGRIIINNALARQEQRSFLLFAVEEEGFVRNVNKYCGAISGVGLQSVLNSD